MRFLEARLRSDALILPVRPVARAQKLAERENVTAELWEKCPLGLISGANLNASPQLEYL